MSTALVTTSGGSISTRLKPSGDITGVTDTNAIKAALVSGNADLGQGNFNIIPGQIIVGPQQRLQGLGAGNTVLLGRGGSAAQPVVTFRNAAFPTAGDPFSVTNVAGWSGGFTVDGTNVNAGVYGIEIGDLYHVTIMQFLVREFNGAGSIGLRFNNAVGWTERIFVQGHISHAAQCVSFEHVDGGGGQSTNSLAYSTFILTVRANNSQNGIRFFSGVSVYGGLFTFGGNFNASVNAANTSVALDIGSDASSPVVQAESGSIVFETNGSGANPQATDCNIGAGAAFRLTGNVIFRGGNPWVAGTLVPATNNQFLVTGFCQTQGLGKGAMRGRKSGNLSVATGQTANTPGAVTTISPDGAQYQCIIPIAFTWTVTAIGAETIQLNITTNYTDGTTNTQNFTTSANISNQGLNASQIAGMYSPNKGINSQSLTVQSTIGSSTAVVTVTFAGLNAL